MFLFLTLDVKQFPSGAVTLNETEFSFMALLIFYTRIQGFSGN